MNRSTLALSGLAVAALCTAGAATFGSRLAQMSNVPDVPQKNGMVLLPNGWQVSPAGTSIALPGDMPLTMVRSTDGKYLIVNTAGFHDHSINVIDLASGKCVESVAEAHDWAGMCLSGDGNTLYVSSGGSGGKKKKQRRGQRGA